MASRWWGWGATAIVAVVFGALAAWGALLLRRAPTEHGIVGARTVAVRDAAAAAGEGTPVRLRGTLVAAPTLVTRGGRELAVQMLEVTHAPPGGGEAVVAYRRVQPSQVFLSDGDSVVVIEPDDADPAFLPLLVSGVTQAGGRLPPDVVTQLVAGFDGLPGRAGADVRVRGIGAGRPAVAYGTLVLREGVPSLVPPSTGGPLVLAAMSFTELEREIRSRDRLARLAGWSLVVVGAVGLAGMLYTVAFRQAAGPSRSARS
jgi:hypothetical protein